MIYLGIDCGTQSTKVVALDSETGTLIASASQKYDVLPGLPPGHLEQHPATWTDALNALIPEVVELLGARRADVRGIGVSGQQHGFVPLDAEGCVIRPAKLWCDTSTTAECDYLRTALGGRQALIERVGLDMLPGFTAPKILWLKNHEPENFAKLHTVLLPHDYLNYYLTGVCRMEYGDASGTALLDVRARVWAKDVVAKIDPGLGKMLPALGSSREPVGLLKLELAQRWNLPANVVISAGGGDNMMGAIGTANIAPGCVTASLGTSGTIYACSDRPVLDPQGEVAGFCDSTDAWLPLICTMNVTVATEAVRKLFNWSHAEMDAAIADVAPGADGLLFLPYLQGERTPNLPNGTGVFHGLTPRNMTPGHLARATMEGVTLGLGYGLNRFRELGLKPREIRLTGGGSQSPVWRQICADIFGCRIVTLAEAEGAALGAAIQALAVVQTEKTIAGWARSLVKVKPGETTEPHGDFSYEELQRKHTGLMQALAESRFL